MQLRKLCLQGMLMRVQWQLLQIWLHAQCEQMPKEFHSGFVNGEHLIVP